MHKIASRSVLSIIFDEDSFIFVELGALQETGLSETPSSTPKVVYISVKLFSSVRSRT